MPKDKDLKRLVRERMAKTGESYTVARCQLLAKRSAAGERLGEPELAELAGMSTTAVVRATGHDWTWWLDRLDAADCRKQQHREITLFLAAEFDISPWWVQSVAVGYERIVGLRKIGQRRDGSFDANKAKTFAVPVEVLFGAFEEAAERERWLPGIDWQVRRSTASRSIRLDWPDGCPVDLWFTAKGDAKSSVQVQHRKLASKESIAEVKEDWAQRFDDLARFLAEAG